MATERSENSAIVDELRTKRLAVVDNDGVERAVVEVVHEHIELRLVAGSATDKCEVLLFAGYQSDAILAAGVELWVNGNSAGGCSAVLTGKDAVFGCFPWGDSSGPTHL